MIAVIITVVCVAVAVIVVDVAVVINIVVPYVDECFYRSNKLCSLFSN